MLFLDIIIFLIANKLAPPEPSRRRDDAVFVPFENLENDVPDDSHKVADFEEKLSYDPAEFDEFDPY